MLEMEEADKTEEVDKIDTGDTEGLSKKPSSASGSGGTSSMLMLASSLDLFSSSTSFIWKLCSSDSMIFSIEKKGAEEVDEEAGGEDEQVDGDIGAEEGDGEDVDGNMDVDGKIRGRIEVRSRGLGLPCLQGRLRNLVSTTASP